MSQASLRVKIYGARGSHSPTHALESRVGVNTSCVRIDFGETTIILDAGSGIINLGNDLLSERKQRKHSSNEWKGYLFFTHMHMDHLVGFPYFPMIYMPQSEIHFFSPRILGHQLEDVLNTLMDPPFFPVSIHELPFKGLFHQIVENQVVCFHEDHFEICGVTEALTKEWQVCVSCMRDFLHPKGGAYIYKIEDKRGKKIVFASDTEGMIGGNQRLINFARKADVLFHDAQYTPAEYAASQGFGHSTYEMACEVARKAEVRKLFLFHHDPGHDDKRLKEIEKGAQKIFGETFIAAENTEIIL